MLWRTGDIKKLIKTSLDDESIGHTIEENGQGGDVDTNNLRIEFYDEEHTDPLFVRGFNSVGDITTPDDVEVEMIELSDGLDSRGGLNSKNRTTCVAYGVIMSALRQDGWDVIPSLDDYF